MFKLFLLGPLPSGLFARKEPVVGRRRIEMFQYRQVLVRLRAGDAVREIARCGLMGRDKLSELRAAAELHGWRATDGVLGRGTAQAGRQPAADRGRTGVAARVP
ncbi:MAG: hypothetical protein DI587_39225 [Variovorax paradoxus]|nr:MAG: hypothetical protein DI583_39225 [Variovorax paradoxus]PZP98868.1 MAG: hypothetical protein DI587_39225 [Variovorax paradoxus]